MTSDQQPGPDGQIVNPFSPTAVARMLGSGPDAGADTITIETAAVRQARQLLDDYLDSSPGPGPGSRTTGGDGAVIAVVGEYGTGKTHLAMDLYRRCVRRGVTPLYLDAPPGSFVELYHRFVAKLDRADVLARVREYYADIVAADLDSSGLTAGIADRVRAGAVDPAQVVDRLGLMDSSFLHEVQRRLSAVTQNDAFGAALTLLLRPGFASAVWEWLEGHGPDPILAERGIAAPIDQDVAALEAMGVFALLYGRREQRFVLLVDELDKLLSASNRPTAQVLAAFKTLLRVFAGARAQLVLFGVPDFLGVLTTDVRERIGSVIWMTGLSGADTRQFIQDSQRLALGSDRLAPFTTDTVDYLVELADGTSRKVIQLCYHVYRAARDAGSEVTHAMVRDAARTQFDVPTAKKAHAAIRTELTVAGLPYLRDHLVGSTAASRVDYWVEVSDEAACAVLLTESVLDRSDVEALNRRANAVRGASPAGVLLVVVGHLPSEWRGELSESLGSEPLRYDDWTFPDAFGTAVKIMTRQAEAAEGDDELARLRDRIDRLNRQQASIYRSVEQVVLGVEDLRSASERRLGAMQQVVAELTVATARRAGAAAGPPVAAVALPAEVAALFSSAVESLDRVDELDRLITSAFAEPPAAPGAPATPDPAANTSASLRVRLAVPDVLGVTAVAVLLRTLVESFRDRVAGWFAAFQARRAGAAGHSLSGPGAVPAEVAALTSLCGRYDAIYETLPVFRLPPARATFEFDTLAARVRSSLVQIVGGPEG